MKTIQAFADNINLDCFLTNDEDEFEFISSFRNIAVGDYAIHVYDQFGADHEMHNSKTGVTNAVYIPYEKEVSK